ncbi:MAG: hypothetical protein U1F06_07925 [Steroidobacteraceae bacterium]
MALQLQHGLTGIGMRCGKMQREAGVDRRARGIAEPSQRGAARLGQRAEQRARDLRHRRTAQADDADGTAPWRGRDCDDGIGRHGISRLRRGGARRYARAFAAWAAMRRLMFHCCRIERTVFVTQ